uniref:Monocyte to macrophage differentiation factor 2 n=1 Tax=Parastrongyloides trichosuri TaxID=131310 RepID=A0A0N4ZEW8_PARTI
MCSGCDVQSIYMNPRAKSGTSYNPTKYEHYANLISHLFPIPLFGYGMLKMIQSSETNIQYLISCIYSIFTLLLFTMSSSYHLSELLFRPLKPTLRYYLHITDRVAIYFFIASSYTPWLILRHCDSFFGSHMKWMVWAFAVFGCSYQISFHERYKTFETILYVFIAASPAMVFNTMTDQTGLEYMVFGGLIYLSGVIFFKMDGKIPFAHAIWHLHVVLGAAIHTYTVYKYLIIPSK